MKIQTTFLHSKIARRIFWLFVLCALIPITVLALVSLYNVSGQLKEESHRRLHQAAREEAMIVLARLVSLEGDLKLVALAERGHSAGSLPSSVNGTLALSTDLGNRIKGLDLVKPDRSRQRLFGEVRSRFDLSADELAFLRNEKNVLTTFPCEPKGVCIYLSRQLDADHPEKGILIAEINPTYLWDVENLSSESGTCIFDQTGQTL